MPYRKNPLVNGEVYHVISKSIANFKIFRNDDELKRMLDSIKYYQIENPPLRFAIFAEIKDKEKFYQNHLSHKNKLVEIIAYCLMPTHIHLLLLQIIKNGVSKFMNNILNSYSHYFNIKTKRRGPLGESRFNNVLIKTDEQLLHVTRYIHLNPVSAYLVNRPEDWNFSSYKEFLKEVVMEERICNYSDVIDIEPKDYKKFVNSQIVYQRELAKIKKLFLE